MHHFWSRFSMIHSPAMSTTHEATFKSTKNKEVKLHLPKNEFFPDGSPLSDQQSEDIADAVLAILNMTAAP